MKRIVLCMICALILSLPAQANLLTNGDFETGDLSGWWTWVEEPDNQSAVIDGTMAFEGDYSAQLASATSTWSAQLGQYFTVGEGDLSISFMYYADVPGDWGSLGANLDYWDGSGKHWAGWWSPFDGGPAPEPLTWVPVTLDFTLPAGTYAAELKIEVANWATVNFDNFEAVPEPATMLLLGLGSLLLTKRRK